MAGMNEVDLIKLDTAKIKNEDAKLRLQSAKLQVDAAKECKAYWEEAKITQILQKEREMIRTHCAKLDIELVKQRWAKRAEEDDIDINSAEAAANAYMKELEDTTGIITNDKDDTTGK